MEFFSNKKGEEKQDYVPNGGITLVMLEAYTRDVGRGIARIDHDTMRNLGVESGDYVYVLGRRKTIAKCHELWPADSGKGAMRADGIIRNNSDAKIGDTIQIIKAHPIIATHIKFISMYYKVFSWATLPNVPFEAHRLLETLRNKYHQNWIRSVSTSITRSSNGRAIMISDSQNAVRLLLTKEATVVFELPNKQTYELWSVPKVDDVDVLGFDPAPDISEESLHGQLDGMGFAERDFLFVIDSKGKRQTISAMEWEPRSDSCIIDRTSHIQIVPSESLANLKYPEAANYSSKPASIQTNIQIASDGYLVGPELDTDKGLRLVRLEKSKMDELGIEAGDVVNVSSQFGSYKARCYELYPVDNYAIRMNKEIRSNLGIKIGDSVAVTKVEKSPMTWLTLSPVLDVVFEWSKVPAFPQHSINLIRYCKTTLNLDWINEEITSVSKSDENTIMIQNEERWISARLTSAGVRIETDEGTVYPLAVIVENDRTIIFDPSPTITADYFDKLLIDETFNQGDIISVTYNERRRLRFQVRRIYPAIANVVDKTTKIELAEKAMSNVALDTDVGFE